MLPATASRLLVGTLKHPSSWLHTWQQRSLNCGFHRYVMQLACIEFANVICHAVLSLFVVVQTLLCPCCAGEWPPQVPSHNWRVCGMCTCISTWYAAQGESTPPAPPPWQLGSVWPTCQLQYWKACSSLCELWICTIICENVHVFPTDASLWILSCGHLMFMVTDKLPVEILGERLQHYLCCRPWRVAVLQRGEFWVGLPMQFLCFGHRYKYSNFLYLTESHLLEKGSRVFCGNQLWSTICWAPQWVSVPPRRFTNMVPWERLALAQHPWLM